MPRPTLFWRFFVGYAGLVLLLLVTLSIVILPSTRRAFEVDVENSLRAQSALLGELARRHLEVLEGTDDEEALGHPAVEELERAVKTLRAHAGAVRYTVVRPDGLVLVDSHESAAALENHSARPELRQALQRGEGLAQRYSRTLGVDMMYVALAVEIDGRTVGLARTSEPLDAVDARIAQLRAQMLLGGVGGLLLSLLVGGWIARRITEPLRAVTSAVEEMSGGQYGRRIQVESTREVGTLASAFNTMGEQLQTHLETIQGDRSKILAILAAMKEGVIAVDHDEYVLHMNRAAGEMLEIDPGTAIGHHVWEVVRVTDVCRIITDTIRAGEAQVAEASITVASRDRSVEMQSSVLRDAEREGAGAVLVLHDISEIRRLEGMRSDFVSNVSHELKTPLTAISGLVESMLDDPEMEADTQHRFLVKVHAQSRRLGDLVQDLLTLARAERGEQQRDQTEIDLRRVLGASLQALRPVADEKGLSLEADLGDAALIVLADEESLRQIFDNLLSNAIRYTPAEGRVAVRAWADASGVQAEVADTGPGIAAEHRDRIFERFYRVDSARSRELGGTGLGLSIVKHRVLGLGGQVSVQSESGEGSRFHVQLPAAGAH